MSKVTMDAEIEGPCLVMRPFGKRVVLAILPDGCVMTSELAAAISVEWNRTGKTVPESEVERMMKEFGGA